MVSIDEHWEGEMWRKDEMVSIDEHYDGRDVTEKCDGQYRRALGRGRCSGQYRWECNF